MVLRKVFFYGFLALAWIVFGVIFLELGLRAYFKIAHLDIDVYRNFSSGRVANIFQPDDVLGWRLLPSVSRNARASDFDLVYQTNSLGLREKEVLPSSSFRVLFLGDSMTFGEGVLGGERFSDILERELPNLYSINAGVPGYGIHQMLAYLEKEGLSLDPDLVICVIFREDLVRALHATMKTAPHVETARRTVPVWLSIRGMASRMYLYHLLRVKIALMQDEAALRKRDAQMWEVVRKGESARFKILNNAEKEDLLRQESFRIFREFKKFLGERNVPFLVVNIQLSPIPWLEDFLRQEGVDYLDISSELRSAKDIQFKIDPHYNAKGNRIIGDALKAYLLKEYPIVNEVRGER